jgi:hypothetical protein
VHLQTRPTRSVKILELGARLCLALKSQSTSSLQQLRQVALDGLEITVAANVLLVDVDVGYRLLAVELGESGLDLRAVVNLVQLDGVELGVQRGQQLLRGSAVGAVRLGENGYLRAFPRQLDTFKARVGWLPLIERAGSREHLPTALSSMIC